MGTKQMKKSRSRAAKRPVNVRVEAALPLTPAQRLLAAVRARPADACNVDVLYRGTNGNRTVTLRAGYGFTNYDFRAEARRTHGYPSARVQNRAHAEWFARQPEFEVLIPRDEHPPSLDNLAARVRELEFYVSELLERVPMTEGARIVRREGY